MRRSHGMKLLFGDTFEGGNPNQLIGISFGADYCAEHEWGIKDIQQEFKMQPENIGIEKYLVRANTEKLVWIQNNNKNPTKGGFVLNSYLTTKDFNEIETIAQGYRGVNNAKYELLTAWNSRSFAVLTRDKTVLSHLRTIYDALVAKRACIWLGGGGVFQNAGLVIAISDHIPESVKQSWVTAHTEQLQLKEDFNKTGIEAKLKNAGKDWFALTPMRQKDGSLKVWLNPYEQGKYNHGLFTIQELEMWAENKGPVIKSTVQRILR